MEQASHGKAAASLVLGIVGVVCWFFGYSSVLSIIVGIVAVVLAKGAAREGNTEGICRAGKVLGIISIVGGVIALILAIVLVGGLIAVYMGS